MKYIAIHHTAVGRGIQSAQFYAVNRYHKQKWNMKSELGWYTGYNYFIGTNGAVTQTRKIGEETVAIEGHNKDTIHVCLAGNFNYEYPNNAQEDSLVELINKIKHSYPNAELKLHRELDNNRTCAGQRITRSYLNSLFAKLRKVDEVDKEKKEEILRLKSQFDKLREILNNLLEQLRKRKNE